jgi:hypothetical protein
LDVIESNFRNKQSFFVVGEVFCETKSLTVNQGNFFYSKHHNKMDLLVSIVNNFDCLENFTFKQSVQVVYLERFFRSVKPTILMRITNLNLNCGGASISPALIKLMESKCFHLRSLALSCSMRCESYHFHQLFANNNDTLNSISLTGCGQITDSFFSFMLCTFKDGILAELLLKDCRGDDDDDDNDNDVISDHYDDDDDKDNAAAVKVSLWSSEALGKFIEMVVKLRIFMVYFDRRSEWFQAEVQQARGFTYDGRDSSHRQLLLMGLGSVGYTLLNCLVNLHSIMMLYMRECTSEVMINMLSCSPCLRKFSVVSCDKSFTKYNLILVAVAPSVTELDISSCSALRADSIEEICFHGKNNLKVFQVCDRFDFQFIHLLNIVICNHNLVRVILARCGVSLSSSEIENVRDKLKHENTNLELCMKRNYHEVYLLTFP